MSKFRKKPIVIEAVQILAADYNPQTENNWDGAPFSDLPPWLTEALKDERISVHPDKECDYAMWRITTIHGNQMIVGPGDWIIPEPDGIHHYPCKPDIFEATYEPVEAVKP